MSKKVAELPFHRNYRNFRILFSQQAIVRSMQLKRSKVPNQILKNHLSLLNHLKTTITYKKNKKKRQKPQKKQKNKVKKTPFKKNRFFTTVPAAFHKIFYPHWPMQNQLYVYSGTLISAPS